MIRIRPSEAGDNHALLALTRSAHMDGTIALRIDRDPEFARLARMRGDDTSFVAVDEGRVVGCISVSYRSAFVNGDRERVGYIADLKVAPDARGGPVAFRLLHAVFGLARRQPPAFYFCVVADGNHLAQALLSGRTGLPPFLDLGLFTVRSLIPRPTGRRGRANPPGRTPGGGLVLEAIERTSQPTSDRLQPICDFVNETNRPFLFSPMLTPQDLMLERPEEPECLTTLVATDRGHIVATATVEDMGYAKVDVPISGPIHLRLALEGLRLVATVVPGLRVPRIGRPIRSVYLRHVAVAPGHHDSLALLIDEARALAHRKRYSFVTVGMHVRDPRLATFKSAIGFDFLSRGFVARVPATQLTTRFDTEIPIEDYALV